MGFFKSVQPTESDFEKARSILPKGAPPELQAARERPVALYFARARARGEAETAETLRRAREITSTPGSVVAEEGRGSAVHQAQVSKVVQEAAEHPSHKLTKRAAENGIDDLRRFAEFETVDRALEELTPAVYTAMPEKSVNYKEKVIDVVAGARVELQKRRQRVELFPTKGNRKSLSEMIGKLTLGGEAMPIFMMEVASGTLTVPIVTKAGLVVEAGPTIDQRMHAHEWLADRFFGKAPERHEISPGSTEEQKLEELSDEQLSAVSAGAAILSLKKSV